MLDEVGLRFAAFGLSRNKNNASTNSHGVLRLVEIGEPSYAKPLVGQSYEISRQRATEFLRRDWQRPLDPLVGRSSFG